MRLRCQHAVLQSHHAIARSRLASHGADRWRCLRRVRQVRVRVALSRARYGAGPLHAATLPQSVRRCALRHHGGESLRDGCAQLFAPLQPLQHARPMKLLVALPCQFPRSVDSVATPSLRPANDLLRSAIPRARLTRLLRISRDSRPGVRQGVTLEFAGNHDPRVPERVHRGSSHWSYRCNERPRSPPDCRLDVVAAGSPSRPCDSALSSGSVARRLG